MAAWTVVLFASAIAYLLTGEGPAQGLLAGVAFAAVVQVVGYTLPGAGIREVWRLAAVAALVAPAALVLRGLPGLTDLPTARRFRPAILLLVVATAPLAFAAWQIAEPRVEMDVPREVLAALAVAFAAFVEELCFRRIVHVGARGAYGNRAFFISAVVWASGVAGTQDAAAVGLLLVAGVIYGLAYDWLGRWWPGAVSHATVAVLVFVVLPAR